MAKKPFKAPTDAELSGLLHESNGDPTDVCSDPVVNHKPPCVRCKHCGRRVRPHELGLTKCLKTRELAAASEGFEEACQ